ncbi:MAG: CoA pyrophosphatase [Pseudomonadota bacterium]
MNQWQEQISRGLAVPGAQRERHLFQELNPKLAHAPILKSPPQAPRPASVLIGVRGGDDPTIVLTVRAPTMPSHAGQIGLPGGTPKEEDDGDVGTALREAEEEVGLARSSIDVLGTLGPHHGGLGYVVTPVIGIVDPGVPVEPCPREVSEAFEVPLSAVLDQGNHVVEQRIFNHVPYDMYAVPVFDTGGVRRNIWGLTAGILRTFSEVFHYDGGR